MAEQFKSKLTMDIEKWLEEFRTGWTSNDIEAVMELFDESLEYWETPHRCITSLDQVREEWQAINQQKNIKLATSIFSSSGDSHAIFWQLNYLNEGDELQEWSGTYLIRLNSLGKCFYFFQSGEKKV